jgi:hypothetical protein
MESSVEFGEGWRKRCLQWWKDWAALWKVGCKGNVLKVA